MQGKSLILLLLFLKFKYFDKNCRLLWQMLAFDKSWQILTNLDKNWQNLTKIDGMRHLPSTLLSIFFVLINSINFCKFLSNFVNFCQILSRFDKICQVLSRFVKKAAFAVNCRACYSWIRTAVIKKKISVKKKKIF